MEDRHDAAQLRRAEDVAFSGVVAASPNAIVAVDARGRITYANLQVQATFGYERDELIGRPIEHLIPERVREAHVGHRHQFSEHPGARPMGIGVDLAGRRKDGSEFPVEISLSPVETRDGPLVFATVVDITARKAAEAALADSERRFRAVLDASPNAVVGIDVDGKIVYVNPQVEETFGFTRTELLGRAMSILLPERVRERHLEHRLRFMSHPVARPMGIGLDLAGRRKDGREFPVEISLSPVETPEGLQVFATIVDITARKAVEEQLLQAQKLESIGRLAGGIAHDFNNMLFAILGYAELLAQDLAPEHRAAFDFDDALTSVAGIAQAGERAAELTRQLLAFGRKQVVRPEVVELDRVVRRLEPMLNRLIGEDVRLVVRLNPRTGSVNVDPGQLDQILVNLVVNARDAMPSGGTVTIESGNAIFDEPYALEHFDVTPGSYVFLAVTDTGEGMDQETRTHLFEPFFTTKELGKGTGLGLATIYGIIRQAGGHIWLYSEPGQGTTFKLYFPRVDDAAAASRAVHAEPHGEAGTILIVEDEPAVRQMTRAMLERAGYTVVAASDGREALATLDRLRGPVAAVVTDVVMPNMSGIELAERVMDRYPDVGIVLLSGYTAETLNLERVTRRGAEFVAKPVESGELLAAIRHVTGQGAAAAT